MEENISYHSVKSVKFQIYSTEEIKELSVLEITNTEILDSLGNSSPGGFYDLRLGPNERDDVCQTCGLNFLTCAGHVGHISLPVTVYNPVFFPQLYQLLRGSCFLCHRLLAEPIALSLTIYQLQALDHGLVSTVHDLADVITDPSVKIASTEDMQIVIKNKLESTFQKALKGNPSCYNEAKVNSVVECRRMIIKEFGKDKMMGAPTVCPHCRKSYKKLIRHQMRIYRNDTSKSSAASSKTGTSSLNDIEPTVGIANKELLPEEAKQHLMKLWENESVFLQHYYKTSYRKDLSTCPLDMFFMTVIIVPPSRFRRLNILHGRKYADPQTLILNEVLKDCINLKKLMRKIANLPIKDTDKDELKKLPGKTDAQKYSFLYQQLQNHVTEIFDSDVNKNNKSSASKGIKQILEKKEGLFRLNMNGKRVNFAARSVISPDPYIMVNEIGIPMVFAKTLTFPEPVTAINVENLRQAVLNGPDIHPGASFVTLEDGHKMKLQANDPAQRHAIANTLLTPQVSAQKIIGGVKIVHRHIKNGDMVLINRQPTLHKPSIMAHKARILPGEKTLRLHYSNCKSYNADFDGDEMNCHFPQSYLGQGECRHIVNVSEQYLVPKDGTPLGGLIQDHIIAAVLLTTRGRFFTKDAYQQLIYSAMSFHQKPFKLLPPTIIKPEQLWSGKQVVSTLVINLVPEGKIPPSLEGKAKVSSKKWTAEPPREWMAGGTPLVGDSMSESEVVIRYGELLCGVIDKAQIGPTPYSFIHLCYELYGGETSSVLLTALARLLTHFLQYYAGFTLGIEDILVVKKANKKRRKILKTSDLKGLEASAKALEVENTNSPDLDDLMYKYKETHFCRDDFGLKMLDMEMKNVTHSLSNEVNEACISNGLTKRFPYNNLQLMVESGAKGASVNAMQISCLLGQIELEGRRMPLMLNGASLPSFQPYATSPLSGGFVSGRFLSGIVNQEYFFHCMAGREGLIDTAVKTSRSGYLQRCLIKHLEGITVNYDQTVRDSDGTVIQFLYGEDGMDPQKMQILKENKLHLLGSNYKAAMSEKEVNILKNRLDLGLKKRKRSGKEEMVSLVTLQKEKIKKWKKKHCERDVSNRVSHVSVESQSKLNTREQLRHIMSWHRNRNPDEVQKIEEIRNRCPDPVNSKFQIDATIGAISEKMDSLIEDYIQKNPHRMFWNEKNSKKKCTTDDALRDLCYYRSLKSIVEPGEAVGLLAAQSIGEPSTQMTLNTFHFAGKGEMNVTLGIPRIREILMTASPNIATPTMDLPLLDLPDIQSRAEKLTIELSPVALKDVLDDVKIKEYLRVFESQGSFGVKNSRHYEIRFNFIKYSEYKGHLNTKPAKILDYIESTFIKKLIIAIKKKMKLSATSKVVDVMKESGFSFAKSGQNDDDEGGDADSPPAPKEHKMDEGGEGSGESEGEGDSAEEAKRGQEQEYEDPEDEEYVPESGDEEEGMEESPFKADFTEDEEESELKTPVKKEWKRHHKALTKEQKAMRINYVKCLNSWIANYDFDADASRWCTVTLQCPLNEHKIDVKTLLEEEISKANIHQVQDIKEAILVKNPNAKDGSMMIKTNGVNLLEAFKHVSVLDINKVYSNNIHAIAMTYGIEAAAQAIKKEIVNVFAAYGIQVDPRHLSLLADYMTSSGQYRPCNRHAMEGNASPLQKMSFETTKNFLVDSMFDGVEDTLSSPSSNITLGQLSKAGTGLFSLYGRCDVQS